MKISKILKHFLLILVTCQSALAFAAYSSMSVFGDSLSDGGDLDTAVISYYKLTGDPAGITNPPYDRHRFSNGAVAVEYLASGLGLNDTEHFFQLCRGRCNLWRHI